MRTISDLCDAINIGVIEGDLQTEIDAERIRATNAPAIQINTEGACHLSAAQVHHALEQLSLDGLDLIFIENVGNLVCPSAFELGEDGKIVVLSVAEGDDKPIKAALESFAATYGEKARGALFDGQGELLPSVLLLVNRTLSAPVCLHRISAASIWTRSVKPVCRPQRLSKACASGCVTTGGLCPRMLARWPCQKSRM